jgi:di/tricarboxylate transporter
MGLPHVWHPWITLAVTLLILYGLAKDKAPDLLFMGAAVVLALLGVIKPSEAFSGFANEGMLTVAALFVVAAGMSETGVMDHIGDRLLGNVTTERGVLLRLAAICIPHSLFLNNTAMVALMLPVLLAWSRKNQVSPSRLLIPLSFLTILGGTITVIGTSTNLVVQGLLEKQGLPQMSFFEIGKVGLPCALIGTAYLLTLGRWLLPDRKELLEQLGESQREYLVEMLVQPGSRLAGQTVAGAGLRQLPGLFLIEIDRQGVSIGPVDPAEMILANDRLVFTGVVSTIVDLEKIPGLVPASDTAYEVSPQARHGRRLCEAVISPSSPLVGRAIRDADFRALYNAAVVAVHRHGARVTNKIGDIVLRPGDTLLLQVGPHFSRAYRNSRDFYLVSDVDARPLRRERAWAAIVIFAVLVAAMISGKVSVPLAAFLAGGVMVAARCISAGDARKSIDWPVLVAIAASFALGTALEKSGLAKSFAEALAYVTHGLGPTAALAAIYFGTMVLNELISNNAAAVLAFPIAVATATQMGVSHRPFAIAVALASSNAFASPIGYQTHMMVYGPGGYRFFDFVRVGVPMNLLLWVVAVVLIPILWPFGG